MAQQLGGGEWYRDAECGACGKNNVGHESCRGELVIEGGAVKANHELKSSSLNNITILYI